MARVANGRLIEVNLGAQASVAYGGLRSNPISRRIENQAARLMRTALRRALQSAMLDAEADGTAPKRTGYGIQQSVSGARAFGQNFANIRGHIIAPGRMVAHENGSTISPQEGEYLTVPIYDGLRADGSPKLRNPNQWRAYGSFVIKGKKTGKLYIVRKDPNDQNKLHFLYVLVESVTLAKHKGWASNSWQKQIPTLRAEWDSIVASFLTVDMVAEAYSGGKRRR